MREVQIFMEKFEKKNHLKWKLIYGEIKFDMFTIFSAVPTASCLYYRFNFVYQKI